LWDSSFAHKNWNYWTKKTGNFSFILWSKQMRFIQGLIFLAILAYVGWPYFHLFQLASAIATNDQKMIEELVDFEQVNKIHKENLKWKMDNTVGPAEGTDFLPESMREGAEAVLGAFGDMAADATKIDASWMLKRLRQIEGSLWENLTFAFFESPTRFTIRLGQLGRNPIHIQMNLQDWYWRITAVYEC
jgi:hypothetical protein